MQQIVDIRIFREACMFTLIIKYVKLSLECFFMIILLSGCGGSSSSSKGETLEIPVDLPEICHDIDFNINVEMREICGVKTRSYRGYKNVPQYRLLLRPKGGKIVRKGGEFELRLPKMLPIPLPRSFKDKIEFNERSRREYIKSTWEYHEFFPEGSDDRIKIMRINIPMLDGDKKSICYTILQKPRKIRKVQEGYASELKLLKCAAFDRLKPKE
jgi:hypothetical protein